MMSSSRTNGSHNGATNDHVVVAKQSRRRKLLGTSSSTSRDYYNVIAGDNSHDNTNNESSPLELDSRLLLTRNKSHDYATFDRRSIVYYKPRDNNDSFLFNTAATTWQRSLFATISGRWWWIGLALLASTLLWYRHRNAMISDEAYYYYYEGADAGGEWEWDHNVYLPRKGEDHDIMIEGGGDTVEGLVLPQLPRRNVLVAQIAASPALAVLSSISSRPNRAYARQWKMNFVHIGASSHTGTSMARECFDRVHVLHFLVEKQEQEKEDPPPAWPLPPRLVYDAVLFLPPDAIITDLDFDLLQLVPNDDQLVSIAGWPDFGGSTDILLLNLRHRDMPTVARKWLELVQPNDVTCGNHNDIRLLVAAMESLESSSSTSASEPTSAEPWIRSLSETKQGFVENNAIKCIPFSVPESRAQRLLTNAGETKALLQATADAVCYRYYPKCEVF